VAPFFVYESLRFYTAHKVCAQTHFQNELLLSNKMCADPWELHLHGEKAGEACRKAIEENRVSPLSCAWQHMWIKGEPYKVWSMLTDSYWMLGAVVVPSVLLTIWLIFSGWHQTRARKETMSFQREMYKDTLNLLAAAAQNNNSVRPAPLYLEEDDDYRKRRRRDRNYIELVSHN